MKAIWTNAIAAAALLGAAAPLPAWAKVFPIPTEDPIATINVPDAWEPDTFDGGVEMNSPDNEVYIAAEEVEADNLTDAVAETVKTLAKDGLEIKEGACNFSITLVETPKPNVFLMLSYWGSDEAEKANADALTAIAQSIQETK
jgi:hypothetical protein